MMKEIFYSSIGTISLTSHKFKELVEDLIQNEQLTKEEGKRLYDEIMPSKRGRIEISSFGLFGASKKQYSSTCNGKIKCFCRKFFQKHSFFARFN